MTSMLVRVVVSAVLAGFMLASTTLAAQATTYSCLFEAKRSGGDGAIIPGTRGEGKAAWNADAPRDRVEAQKRQACVDANNRCTVLLDRLRQGNPGQYRYADCVMTAQAINGQLVQGQQPVGEWVLLGQREAANNLDRDTINTSNIQGPFRRLRIQVLRYDIDMRSMTVTFGNGEQQHFEINRRLRNQDPGPEFDLHGRERNVVRVEMTYRTIRPEANSVVQVYGMR